VPTFGSPAAQASAGARIFSPTAALTSTRAHLFVPPAGSRRVTSLDGTWADLPPFHREYPAMVYDPVRDRMLEFGGFVELGITNARDDVWALSLTGTQAWTPVATAGTPPPELEHPAMIYDPVRDQLVVWGGASDVDGTFPTDVWLLSLSGTPTWTRVTPSGTPPGGRVLHTAVYDPVRDRMLIFGGQSGDVFETLNDIWALQLGPSPSWTQITPAGGPPPARAGHVMVYDSATDQVVIFGGYTIPLQIFGDMWTLSLSGTPTWDEPVPVVTVRGTPPSPRLYASAIYDPINDRTLVFSGWDGGGTIFNDLNSLTLGASTQWTHLGPANPPAARVDAVAVFDPVRRQMVAFGGQVSGNDDLVMLALTGPLAWTPSTIPYLRPDGSFQSTAILDPFAGRMVVFGGGHGLGPPSNQAWQLPLAGYPAWATVPAAGAPPPARLGHTSILDPVRQRMIVFGGSTSLGLANDLWSLSLTGATTWTPLAATGTPPPARTGHTAVYDPIGDRMIVFGGLGASGPMNDLWSLSLSGTPTWSPLAASGTPPAARTYHSAIYDPLRGRVVLFGGSRTTDLFEHISDFNDTWVLTLGASPAWTQISPTGTPPSVRQGHTAVYDSQHDRMLVFAGTGSFPPPAAYGNDVWALSLASPAWTQLAPASDWPPAIRTGACGVYDPLLDRMLVYGGLARNSDARGDITWTLTFGDRPTPTEVALVEASASPDQVRLAWYGASATSLPATVYRRSPQADWTSIASITGDGTGRFEYVDRSVTPGAHYDYRLGMIEGGVERIVGQAGVDVPTRSVEFALRGFTASPAAGAASISFTLPDASPARLEMFDVRGRRVLSRSVGGMGAGTHVIGLGARAMEPGVYWLRLSHAHEALTSRAVLLR
jgi:hypothetical protein